MNMEKVALDLLEVKKIKKQIYDFIKNHTINIDYIYEICKKTHNMDHIILYYVKYIYNLFINELQLNNSNFIKNEQKQYNEELLKLIKAEVYEYARKEIKRKINELPTLISNINVIDFINTLRDNNDKVGDLTEPIPFDANDIHTRDKPLLVYQMFDKENNIIEENAIIGDFGTHHNNCVDKLKDKIYTTIKITCGYVYNDIVFLGNKEANEFNNWSIVANIIKNKLPQIKKIYHIPDEYDTKGMPLERISEKTIKLSNYFYI